MKQEIIDKYKQKITDENDKIKTFQILVGSFADQENYQESANCQWLITRAMLLNSNYELFVSYLVSDRLDMIDYFSAEIEMQDEHVESLKTDLAIFLDLKDYANAHKYKKLISKEQGLLDMWVEFHDDMGKLVKEQGDKHGGPKNVQEKH